MRLLVEEDAPARIRAGLLFLRIAFPKMERGSPEMLEHLNLEEIVKMPLHMQILYYFGKWGKLVRDEETLTKGG